MKNYRRILLAMLALALAACGTATRFQSTWSSPNAQPLHLEGRKVVAVFVTHDPLLRRRAEDAMVREINNRGAEGVASYTFLSDSEVMDRELAQSRAESLGFAAATVMRIVSSQTIYSTRPAGVVWAGPHYHRFWRGYWGWGWTTAWEPLYPTVDRVVKVETLIYSLERDQLVWAGVTRTFDPGEIESFISELSIAISNRLATEGLVARN